MEIWLRVQCINCSYVARTENLSVGGTYYYTFAHGYLDEQCKRCTRNMWMMKIGVTEKTEEPKQEKKYAW